VWENPFIDQEQYIKALQKLKPVECKQLLEGDWDASPNSKYKQQDCQYYTVQGGQVFFQNKDNEVMYHCKKNGFMRTFFTSDVAGSGGDKEEDGIDNVVGDDSCCGFWGLTHDYRLALIDAIILHEETPEVIDEFVRFYKKYLHYNPEAMVVETNGLGLGILQMLKRRKVPAVELVKSVNKLAFAQTGISKMRQGRIYLPKEHREWKPKIVNQLFVWTGDEDEPDDIVDMVSAAP